MCKVSRVLCVVLPELCSGLAVAGNVSVGLLRGNCASAQYRAKWAKCECALNHLN